MPGTRPAVVLYSALLLAAGCRQHSATRASSTAQRACLLPRQQPPSLLLLLLLLSRWLPQHTLLVIFVAVRRTAAGICTARDGLEARHQLQSCGHNNDQHVTTSHNKTSMSQLTQNQTAGATCTLAHKALVLCKGGLRQLCRTVGRGCTRAVDGRLLSGYMRLLGMTVQKKKRGLHGVFKHLRHNGHQLKEMTVQGVRSRICSGHACKAHCTCGPSVASLFHKADRLLLNPKFVPLLISKVGSGQLDR
jgi:hypothetical protein